MNTDSILGATTGLMSVAVMANVAGKVIGGKGLKVKKHKSKSKKLKW